VICATSTLALNNGVGLRPPMGYNSWYDTVCSSDMNENIMRKTADALVAKGLTKLGYNYVNLDDCWGKGRNSDGTVYPDPVTFPSGIKALADYVHSKGLSFGIYTGRGPETCAGRPGSGGNEGVDAQTYAKWGVDYVKEDSCNAPQDHPTAFKQYAIMRDALNKTGRPMYFALCGWYDWYAPVGFSLGNAWRIGPDDQTWDSVISNININSALARFARPGGWNDPCLLLGKAHDGTYWITERQSRTQFSIWSVMASPLLLSMNVRDMTPFALETYTNAEVIAVDQDKLCRQGVRLVGENLSIRSTDPQHATNVWGRQLFDGSWALVFINVAPVPMNVTCDRSCFQRMGFPAEATLQVRDLWLHQELGQTKASLYTVKAVPEEGGSMMLKFSRK